MSTLTPIKTAFSLGLIAVVLIGTTCFEQQLRLIFDFREIVFDEAPVQTAKTYELADATKAVNPSSTAVTSGASVPSKGEGQSNELPDEIPMQQSPKHDTIKQSTAVKQLNTMTAVEFEALDGIGPVIAQRIVDDRKLHGNFATPEDLKRVKGIGDKTLSKILKSLK